MKKSKITLIVIISLAIILPFLLGTYLRQRVKNNDYDYKYVERQRNIISGIRTLEAKQAIYNELKIYVDGSTTDTLDYYSSRPWVFFSSEISPRRDTVPRFFAKDHVLTLENKYNTDSTYNHEVSYAFGGRKLEKIIVNRGQLYFYNSTNDRKENIDIEIFEKGSCVIGNDFSQGSYAFDKKPDKDMGRIYKNLNVHIENGELKIGEYTSVDTLLLTASSKDAKINIGKGVKIKCLKGELQSLSQIEGSFENMEMFRTILKP